MSRIDSMTSAAVKSAFDVESEDDFIDLVEMTVPGVGGVLRFCNKAVERLTDGAGFELEDEFGNPVYGVRHKGNPYVFLPYRIPYPQSEAGRAPETSIEIDNLTRELIPYVRQMTGRARIDIITIHTSDLDRVQTSITGLYVNGWEYDDASLRGQLGINTLTDTAYPAHSYTRDRFPGMF